MKLDDFDSVFRSAVKARFHFAPPSPKEALLVTDLGERDAAILEGKVRAYLAEVAPEPLSWRTVHQDEYDQVVQLLGIVEESSPDLIVAYRHLRLRSKKLCYSLGAYVDTLTQATSVPVLLLPPPDHPDLDRRLAPPRRVLVITDHLTGDDRLASWGVQMCSRDGTLFLAHVEDAATYERYMEIIGMIPDLDTESTAERIRAKLLARPADYIESIVEVLETQGIEERVVPIVEMGHALSDYRRLVDEHEIELLVLNTKDAQQLAMHGMGYAISVEFQDRPMLLL